MDEELRALYEAAPGPGGDSGEWEQVSPSVAIKGSAEPSLEEMWAALPEPPAPQTTGEKVASGIFTAGNSALLGWGDEALAGGATLVDEGLEALGLIPEATMSERFSTYVEPLREELGQFRTENPKTAFAADVVGGFLTGGAGAAKTGVFKAPSVLGRTIKGAGTGSLMGTVAGAGYADGDMDERVKGGMTGFGMGLVFGAGIGGVSGAVAKMGHSRAARAVRDRFKKQLSSELGAVGNLPGASAEKVGKAQRAILKIFEEATDEELLIAADRVERAHKQGAPITMFEALDVPQGYIDAKAIRTTRGGRTPAARFMKGRREKAGDRIGAILDDISPEDSIYRGSAGIIDTADEIVKSAEKGRTAMSRPLYEAAAERNPIIKSDRLNELLQDPMVQEVMVQQRKYFARRIPESMPDNHYKVLDQLKKGLDDRISQMLGKEGLKNAGKELQRTRNQIVNIVDNFNPDYEAARKAYQTGSTGINWLKGNKWGTKRDRGLFEDLLSSNEQKAGQAARQLMSKSKDQLRDIGEVFRRYGRTEELRAGIRASLEDNLSRVNEGVLKDRGGSVVDRLFGIRGLKGKLETMLGEDEVSKLWGKLELEALISRGEQEIGILEKAVGSPTAPILKSMGEQKGMIGKILSQSPMTTLREAFDGMKPGEHQQLTKEIAEELFSTPDPKKFKDYLKLQGAYNEWGRQVDAVTAAAQGGGTTGAITGAKGKEKGATTPGVALGIGAAGATAAAEPWRAFLPEANTQTPSGALSSPAVDSAVGFMSSPADSPVGALRKKKGGRVSKQDVKAIEARIDSDPIDSAIYETESNRDAKAKNPNSTASGGFQLIKATAKALGVKDVFDLEQNYQGYLKLRQQHENRFGSDPQIIYGAHFLGAPLLAKYLNGRPMNTNERGLVKEFEDNALPRFLKIYQRILKQREDSSELA